MKTDNLTVRVSGGNRFRVQWADGETDYHFICEADGDTVIAILAGSYHRFPVIYRRDLKSPAGRGPSAGVSYLPAHGDEWAPAMAAIKERIAAERLITAARSAYDREKAERAAKAIRDKAAAVCKAAEAEGIALMIDVDGSEGISRLAAFYDRIQNAAV